MSVSNTDSIEKTILVYIALQVLNIVLSALQVYFSKKVANITNPIITMLLDPIKETQKKLKDTLTNTLKKFLLNDQMNTLVINPGDFITHLEGTQSNILHVSFKDKVLNILDEIKHNDHLEVKVSDNRYIIINKITITNEDIV